MVNTYSEKRIILAIVILTLQFFSTDGRRIAGGGSIFRAPSGNTKPISSSGTSGWSYRRPLLGRNYGGFSGRQSTSNNGFGLGLGAGLGIGYGLGMLSRPYGYGTHGYGYVFYHRTRVPMRAGSLLECAVANYTIYMKAGGNGQEVEVGEGSKVCAPHEDICYGSLSVSTTNVTTFANETVIAIELNVLKGCESSQNFAGTQTGRGRYDSERKCWTDSVKEVNLKITPKNETDNFYEYDGDDVLLGSLTLDFFTDEEVRDSLQLSAEVKRIQQLRRQSEICVCNLPLCNSIGKLAYSSITQFFTIVFYILTKFD